MLNTSVIGPTLCGLRRASCGAARRVGPRMRLPRLRRRRSVSRSRPKATMKFPRSRSSIPESATIQGNILTMTSVGSNAIVFADRPYRAAGHVLTKHFLKEWDEGSDSFAKDPPNATISVLSAEGDTVEDAVLVLKSPKLEGDKLTFEVTVLEGGLSKATGPASLFIDWFAARGYGGRGFVAGGGGWHGAWYGHPNYGAVAGAAALGLGAAAVGAAAAGAYYHPYANPYYAPPPPAACGYYPYPPCY